LEIKKIILMRDTGIPIGVFDATGELNDAAKETQISGMLSAIDSFSAEVLQEGLYTYKTATHRITLIKQEPYILAIFSDRRSLQTVPSIIQDYLLSGIEETPLQKLNHRLKWVFWPDRSPLHCCKGLLLTVGRTISPIWCALSRHNPKFVAFLVSKETTSIALTMVKYFGFELEKNARLFLCDQNDTTSITTAGLDALQFLLDQNLSHTDLLVNATGGTKAMTIALSHISYLYNIPVFYVASALAQEYKADKIYEDEHIELLDNPAESVGVYFEDIAKTAFNSYNFLKAKEYFEKLDRVFDANKRNIYHALKHLAEAYHHWDLFQFRSAATHLTTALQLLEPNLHSTFGRSYQPLWNKLQAQQELLAHLDPLSIDFTPSLPEFSQLILYFELVNNANRRIQQQKSDDAVCRLYRILEATASLLLWKKYQIDPLNFAETAKHLSPTIKRLFQQSSLQTRSPLLNIFIQWFHTPSLPSTLSLLKSWQLLEHLDADIRALQISSHLQPLSSLYQNTILAHGWIPVPPHTLNTLQPLTSHCTQLLLQTFSEYPNLPTLQKTLEFPHL